MFVYIPEKMRLEINLSAHLFDPGKWIRQKTKRKLMLLIIIQIIPENAPYMEDSHITVRSFVDESFPMKMLNKKNSPNYQRNVKGMSKMWLQMKIGIRKNLKLEAKKMGLYRYRKPVTILFIKKLRRRPHVFGSIWIRLMLKVSKNTGASSVLSLKSSTSSTSPIRRHLVKCLKAHGGTRQPQLQVQRGLGDEVQLSLFKYDHALMREKVSHCVMINELPFLHVESFMWNEVMKTATPFYQKITRGTLKGYFRSTYEIEKKKLIELFRSSRRINITTDM